MEYKATNSLSIQTNTTQERNQTDKHLNIMDTSGFSLGFKMTWVKLPTCIILRPRLVGAGGSGRGGLPSFAVGGFGGSPPGNLAILDARRCILGHSEHASRDTN